MPWKLRDPNLNPNDIPKIGTFWKHREDKAIYLRIDNDTGRAALGHDSAHYSQRMYSLNENGTIVHTDINTKDFVCLRTSDIEGIR